jgi:alpha-1,3-mannosyltransferase
MKVLHITPTLFPSIGGIETVIRDLMMNLRRRGIEADAMHIAPGLIAEEAKLDGSKVWRVPLIPNRLIGFAPSIAKILGNYDLLHVHDPQAMAISANVLFSGGAKKKILSTHGGYFHTQGHGVAKKVHWSVFAPMILGQYDEILASSESDFERFSKRVSNVRLVPNGVNVDKFSSIGRNVEPISASWIYWGRLSTNKRLDQLIKTVASAKRSGIDIDLLIAGGDFDHLSGSLAALIAELGLGGNVKLAGPLTDEQLFVEVSCRSVYATASEHEGFGLGVIEAMSAGLAVVCRDMAPLNGFVVDGESGVFLNFDGSTGDIDKLRRLCSQSSQAAMRMQDAACAASARHSWETVIEKYIEAYDRVLAASH